MKLHVKTLTLAALLLAAAVTSLPALRGQNPPSTSAAEQQTDDDPFPLVDITDKFKARDEKDAKRRAKGKRYDHGGGVEDGSEISVVTRFTDWSFNVTELPTEISDVIVVGTVLDARALTCRRKAMASTLPSLSKWMTFSKTPRHYSLSAIQS